MHISRNSNLQNCITVHGAYVSALLLFLSRGFYPPAAEYVNSANQSHFSLVEAFQNLQTDEDAPLENGDLDHEVNPLPLIVQILRSFRSFVVLNIYLRWSKRGKNVAFICICLLPNK